MSEEQAEFKGVKIVSKEKSETMPDKITLDKKTGKTTISNSNGGPTRLVIPPEKTVIFEISYIKDGDGCRVYCKGDNWDIRASSKIIPPPQDLVLYLIRAYLYSRPMTK